MPGYNEIAWLPLTLGLTVAGLLLSWIAWRRRGAAAGMRGAAWSLLPLAAYLTGIIATLWTVGTALVGFVTRFVFSPMAWAGVIVTGLAAVLFVVSGVMRRRGAGRKGARTREPAEAEAAGRPAAPGSPAQAPAQEPKQVRGKKAEPRGPVDDDMAEIEEILRRRGIG
ncbi:cellulose synthase [Bailinhaonella thermotolerans]|uniref:Cellulose synthase n=1 Tax=Bailinhaonella thermotolerans TaxID=1070861 RepID=A0A3A4B4D3_9ACTN|nr:cellulose synthase [Bailinhaonella thermotolerans]RJL36021.1 cellulose synthase [Bailinhaonella thermotolerans]